nr:XkdX family protein [Brevibacillus brevis]
MGITKTGEAATDITKEGIDYTKYISLLYRFGEYTAEDVARFVELGKLTPEQYEGITGEKYETSVVEQQEKVQ